MFRLSSRKGINWRQEPERLLLFLGIQEIGLAELGS